MTNPRFEVIGIDESNNSHVLDTFQTEWEAVKCISHIMPIYQNIFNKERTFPDRIVKFSIRQVWVFNN